MNQNDNGRKMIIHSNKMDQRDLILQRFVFLSRYLVDCLEKNEKIPESLLPELKKLMAHTVAMGIEGVAFSDS